MNSALVMHKSGRNEARTLNLRWGIYTARPLKFQGKKRDVAAFLKPHIISLKDITTFSGFWDEKIHILKRVLRKK